MSASTTSALPSYIGRFAPSPSGPLHMGSLVAALASYLDARAHQGRWYVRMEDLDPPREQPGADRLILEALEALGLHWDGTVLYQSQRHEAYADMIRQLAQQGLVFFCTCSRRQLRANGGIYPGTCRAFTEARPDSAIRCRTEPFNATFEDCIQGPVDFPARLMDDFIVRRRDGLYAYQLAVVADDAWQDITHVIRGMDLLDCTPRQRYLQQKLGLPEPTYGHIPVLVNDLGQKLSKQHKAPPLDPAHARRDLLAALEYLQQQPDPALSGSTVEEILSWGVAHWRREPLRKVTEICHHKYQ